MKPDAASTVARMASSKSARDGSVNSFLPPVHAARLRRLLGARSRSTGVYSATFATSGVLVVRASTPATRRRRDDLDDVHADW